MYIYIDWDTGYEKVPRTKFKWIEKQSQICAESKSPTII